MLYLYSQPDILFTVINSRSQHFTLKSTFLVFLLENFLKLSKKLIQSKMLLLRMISFKWSLSWITYKPPVWSFQVKLGGKRSRSCRQVTFRGNWQTRVTVYCQHLEYSTLPDNLCLCISDPVRLLWLVSVYTHQISFCRSRRRLQTAKHQERRFSNGLRDLSFLSLQVHAPPHVQHWDQRTVNTRVQTLHERDSICSGL